jgi:hypothetical protein
MHLILWSFCLSGVCQGMAQQRALWEVPQDAGQPEALQAWSGVTAHEGRRVRSPEWGLKTGNANKEEGEGGVAGGKSNVVDS